MKMATFLEGNLLISISSPIIFDALFPWLGIYPEGILAEIYKGMFFVALSTRAKSWKQPIYPSIGEWLTKLCLVYIWNSDA